MKRGQLTRKSGLRRTGPPERRTPLAKVGRRRKAERPLEDVWRAAVLLAGCCEAAGLAPGVCRVGANGLEAHHVLPRRKFPEWKWETVNGIAVCGAHHRWLHDHPLEASRLGLLGVGSFVDGGGLLVELSQRRMSGRERLEVVRLERGGADGVDG